MQGEQEGGPTAWCRLRPDPAAVPLDDPLDEGQSDPGPLVLVLAVQPLEDLEQLAGVAHVEAGAIVADVVHGLAVHLLGSYLDARDRLPVGVLDRVSEPV